MTGILDFLYLPMIAGVVLAGIHALLGRHVVERGVIFVGLSLPQIAALGTALAAMQGHEPRSETSYLWALAFAIVAAAVFALIDVRRYSRATQEAIFGIAYVAASAATVLAMSRATSDPQDLEDVLVGNILSVNGSTVLKSAVVYAIVALFLILFRRQFLAATSGLAEHRRIWDLLFYAALAIVVTSSVAIAGVLVVFSYLVVPTYAARMLPGAGAARVWMSWMIGAIVSAIGILVAFKLDLPTGATIVCTFAITLGIIAIVGARRRKDKERA